MPRVLLSDHEFPDLDLEKELFARHGIDIALAQCRTEDDVIREAQGAFGILLQYAPITDRVIRALPGLGIVSRIGAGFDTVDTAACERHGVWVANSPDYGVGEVATHALALALASIRNVVAYQRDIAAGQWHYLSSGPLRRASDMTLGIVGLGRIGKRMAHISRNVFRRVIAADPYLIDGDFPASVERATLFLYDHDADELFSRVARGDGIAEIRVNTSAGIAGSVFLSGQAEIVEDAYADPRFNQEIDRRTGYRTHSI